MRFVYCKRGVHEDFNIMTSTWLREWSTGTDGLNFRCAFWIRSNFCIRVYHRKGRGIRTERKTWSVRSGVGEWSLLLLRGLLRSHGLSDNKVISAKSVPEFTQMGRLDSTLKFWMDNGIGCSHRTSMAEALWCVVRGGWASSLGLKRKSEAIPSYHHKMSSKVNQFVSPRISHSKISKSMRLVVRQDDLDVSNGLSPPSRHWPSFVSMSTRLVNCGWQTSGIGQWHHCRHAFRELADEGECLSNLSNDV